MAKILEFMSDHHSQCDQLYADGETALLDNRLEEGMDLMNAFLSQMDRHFNMEETLLFPVLEEATGMRGGPTEVMRMEHQQMRSVLGQMNDAIEHNEADEVLAAGETLLLLMQQHNVKEEGILYPMADQLLEQQEDDLISRMKAVKTG